MWLNISIIVLFLVCLYLLYIFLMKAVDEDNKANKTNGNDEYFSPTVVSVNERSDHNKVKNKLTEIYNSLKDQEGDVVIFEMDYSTHLNDLICFVEGGFKGKMYIKTERNGRVFERCWYGFSVGLLDIDLGGLEERVFFNCLDNYRLEKSEYWYWSKFVDTNETYKCDGWYKIDNGDYYTNNGIVYRFKDWLEVGSFEDWFVNNRDNLKGRVGLSKDPKEEHWEHFLDLEIKAKKDRLQKCKEWVDAVLKKQQKYNDICLNNEVATTPLIHDYETLKNFCNMSGEKVKFEEYEITNYLLIIRNTLTKV